jgi:uncharacterized protein YecE (DUF72 family)
MTGERPRGRLYAGTSGFAYPAWAPRFYAAGTRSGDHLRAYAARLPAVELNNTFYQQPTEAKIQGWLAASPDAFRFCVKAQRGGSFRALRDGPEQTLAWLTPPYRAFGARLGCVLFRVGEETPRDDAALGRLLAAWPPALQIALEFQHPSWTDDAVHARLRTHDAVLCATDRDGADPPDIRVTGPFLYLRLRREAYDEADLDDWAARIEPFLADGLDAYVFFRHDADGTSALRAEGFAARLG